MYIYIYRPFSRRIFTSTAKYAKKVGPVFHEGITQHNRINQPRLWLEGYGHNNMPQEGSKWREFRNDDDVTRWEVFFVGVFSRRCAKKNRNPSSRRSGSSFVWRWVEHFRKNGGEFSRQSWLGRSMWVRGTSCSIWCTSSPPQCRCCSFIMKFVQRLSVIKPWLFAVYIGDYTT